VGFESILSTHKLRHYVQNFSFALPKHRAPVRTAKLLLEQKEFLQEREKAF
jgi:hypothetical protein